MAVRQCDTCNSLMQEGLLVENFESEDFYYYCEGCSSDSHFVNELIELENTEILISSYEEWYDVEMDEEDFSILMNAMLGATEPTQFADILDILNRENPAHYAPMGVLDQFVTYLNDQQHIYDTLGGGK